MVHIMLQSFLVIIAGHLSDVTNLLLRDGLCFFNIKTMQVDFLVRIDVLIDFVENLPGNVPSNFVFLGFVLLGLGAGKDVVQLFNLVVSVLVIFDRYPLVPVHHDLPLIRVLEARELKVFEVLPDVVGGPKSDWL